MPAGWILWKGAKTETPIKDKSPVCGSILGVRPQAFAEKCSHKPKDEEYGPTPGYSIEESQQC